MLAKKLFIFVLLLASLYTYATVNVNAENGISPDVVQPNAIATNVVAANAVDPKNIDEYRHQQAQSKLNLSSWPVTRIKQLEQLREQLKANIAQLPRHCPIISDNRLGYHSSLTLNIDHSAPVDHQINFTLERAYPIQSIALVPAFNPLRPYGGSYAFPKRFKVEGESTDTNKWIEIVNWLDKDFPNPGSYPVFFNSIDQSFKRIRISAPSLIDGKKQPHFALGEVFIWAHDEKNGLIENVARANTTQIDTSSSYNQTAKWHPHFLTDLDTGLGFPIQEQEVDRQDLLIVPSQQDLASRIEFIIRLNRPRDISRIDFWPAKPRGNIMLPDFGFPENIRVEVADNADFKQAKLINPDSKGDKFGTLFTVSLKAQTLQFIRITMDQLQQLNGQRILGLGEIAVYDAKGEFVSNSEIVANGIASPYLQQLDRLLDGYSWGRRIVAERDWIMGLAQRRPLDEQLKLVNNELTLAHEYWEWLVSRFIIVSIVISLLILVGAFVLLQRSHRQHLLVKQGNRINRDLHDEVGSSLGSITLLADELASAKVSPEIADDLNDLSLMAREANASLREVVWNGDDKSILLSSLLSSLTNRAERILRGVAITVIQPEQVPNIKVSLAVKRHLTLFFKEVIHNCARHANASHLTISINIDATTLALEVKDDGCGFEPHHVTSGWGLNNLVARAEEMQAKVAIQSVPHQGTCIRLQIALSQLSQEPEHGYQTSNE
ncbi:hypothetical protein C2869_17370 [Saccharobesus litoralis]|uniref:Histidine kinase domain-containing protein n=1 Tax=Saccharobesus litoralis TaxID=2172099 RepID=A0A2S0VV84_9ALTE|nr:ATP-binding protein [Saccharobesus litoralis]AWB68082.1 hypothetical protein C2869_17370 [Saccharobesus litoralis]